MPPWTKRFEETLVRFLETHVFADDRDVHGVIAGP